MLPRFVIRCCTEPSARFSLLTVKPVSSFFLVHVLQLLKVKQLYSKSSCLLLHCIKVVRKFKSGAHLVAYIQPPLRQCEKREQQKQISAQNLKTSTSALWHRECLRQFSALNTNMFPFQQPQGHRNGLMQQPAIQWMNMNGMGPAHNLLQPNMMMPFGQMLPMQDQLLFKNRGPRGPHPGAMGPRGQWSQSPNPRSNQFQQQQQNPQQNNNRQRPSNKRKSSEADEDDRHPSKMGRYQQGNMSLNTSNSTAMYMSVVNGVKPIYHVPGKPCDRITEAIVEYYNESHQSEEDLNHKIVLSNCLHCIVRGIFPGCRMFIVGSSLTGFGTHTSDMDLCLLVTQMQHIDQKYEAVHILNAIHKSLRNCTFVKSSQVIKAKVPILKFTDATKNIECDLNINNGVGIRNTHLLKHYCLADNRVAPLMLFIKFWARFHDINDAHKRTISSYSLALMLINYLQVCKPPVVPCLQMEFPERFNTSVDLRSLRLDIPLHHPPSENRESLGELFQGFLHYYAYTFRPESQVVSIRRGCALDKQLVQRNSSEPHQWKCLCIEEPFDLSNTARSVFDPNIFARVRQVFRRSAEQLKSDGDVFSILEKPF